MMSSLGNSAEVSMPMLEEVVAVGPKREVMSREVVVMCLISGWVERNAFQVDMTMINR